MGLAVLYVLAAYFVGAIPFGYIVARKVKGIDIREHGSGNVGGTNVGRVVGKKAGYTTLALDFFKGFIVVAIAKLLFPISVDAYQVIPVLAGIAAVIGHSRSVFIGFKGGKSVITSTGILLALEPISAILLSALAVTTIKITRYVSVGSMLAAFLLPLSIWLTHKWFFHRPAAASHLILAGFIFVYVIYLHRTNIVRLVRHQENRI